MTIFLAAVLGNGLAWCVHVFTWWLRRRAPNPIGCLGYFFGVPSAFASFLLALMVRRTALAVLAFWSVLFLMSWLQSRWVADEDTPFLFALGAFLAEFFFASLFFLVTGRLMSFYFPISLSMGDQNFEGFSISFMLTFLLLAIFRPLVARYSQRFTKLLKPEAK